MDVESRRVCLGWGQLRHSEFLKLILCSGEQALKETQKEQAEYLQPDRNKVDT